MRIKWDNEFKNPWPECGIIEGWGGLLEEAHRNLWVYLEALDGCGLAWVRAAGLVGTARLLSVTHFPTVSLILTHGHLGLTSRCPREGVETDYLQTAVAAGGR